MIKPSKTETRSVVRRAKTIARPAASPRPLSPIPQALPSPAVPKTTPSYRGMLAARFYGPRDVRVEPVPLPGQPGPGDVLLRVTATGICGSDLHTFTDGRIGDTVPKSPIVLGHEFAAVIEAFGSGVEHLRVGTRVAVDPAHPCHHCDLCDAGHPNLCRRLHFCGLYPDDGSLREFMIVPARTCFPVPDSIDDESAAMLEPLGVALHATDLAKIRVGDRVAVLGAGPIGLLLIQTAKLAGAAEIFVRDPLAWRLALAMKLGAKPLPVRAEVDVAIEAAWGGNAIEQAIELARPGGRVVLVGIPSEDRCAFQHSPARRKGLTIMFSRRMKHTYPRAISLVVSGKVDVRSLVTHRFPLQDAAEALALNAAYKDKVVKVIVTA
ncbi:MAG TPA: alcohol dehydrogenase catalytic domain-containing protein [Verrucomicrobiae bacterium]|nr:alcohol dehydrogenase catalytic domain-containing protein [Verrucomicrobiae bacterium]